MTTQCIDNATLLSTIIASSLLIVSEILPYFTSVKANGITGVVASVLKTFIKKQETEEQNPV